MDVTPSGPEAAPPVKRDGVYGRYTGKRRKRGCRGHHRPVRYRISRLGTRFTPVSRTLSLKSYAVYTGTLHAGFGQERDEAEVLPQDQPAGPGRGCPVVPFIQHQRLYPGCRGSAAV